jgi:hypothetical protein
MGKASLSWPRDRAEEEAAMANDASDPVRTRRSLLMAAAGGAAVATAAALGRPAHVLASDGDPMLLGADNHSEAITTLTRDVINNPGDATFLAQTTISAAIVGHASETG